MSVTRNIIEGPGKSDLQTSFFNPQLKLSLLFTLQSRMRQQGKINIKVRLRITQIQLEDGSGNNFNFWGFDWKSGKDYQGYYSTKTRKGWIKEINN